MMDWSNEFTLRFLELYKDEPCLWDPSNPHYKRKEKISNAWQRLGQETGKPVSELRRKKDSLMATFRGLSRKKKASIQMGAEGDAVYQPIWFAFNVMESFLGEVYGINTPDMITPENENSDVTDLKSEENEYSQPIPSIPSPPSFQSTRRKHSMDLREAENEMKEAFALLKNVVSRNEEEDDCDLYGRLLAKRLRRLPDWERHVIMHEIDGLVLNSMHRFGSPSSPSPLVDANGQPFNSNSLFSSQNQPEQQHTEDSDIDSKANIITFEERKILS